MPIVLRFGKHVLASALFYRPNAELPASLFLSARSVRYFLKVFPLFATGNKPDVRERSDISERNYDSSSPPIQVGVVSNKAIDVITAIDNICTMDTLLASPRLHTY